MTTVVTGAGGFVGRVLVQALVDQGRAVRAVDRAFGHAPSRGVEHVTADVLDPASLAPALDGADVVYHLAAVISVTGDPHGRVRAVNVVGAKNVAEAALAAGVRRFVHCSSVHAYDLEVEADVHEGSARAIAPRRPAYDRSKAEGEEQVRRAVESGLDAVVVNPTGIIGPLDHAPSRMGQVFIALRRRRIPALVDGGFNWVDVRDVAASLIAAETKGRTGENYLLPGHTASMRELAQLVEDVSGVRAPRLSVPLWVAGLSSPVANVVSRRTGSALWPTTEALHALRYCPRITGEKARRELGHQPRSLRETIEDTLAWFEARSERERG